MTVIAGMWGAHDRALLPQSLFRDSFYTVKPLNAQTCLFVGVTEHRPSLRRPEGTALLLLVLKC